MSADLLVLPPQHQHRHHQTENITGQHASAISCSHITYSKHKDPLSRHTILSLSNTRTLAINHILSQPSGRVAATVHADAATKDLCRASSSVVKQHTYTHTRTAYGPLPWKCCRRSFRQVRCRSKTTKTK